MSEEGRLAIKSLVLENFKSYSGRHCIGPFHKSFTSLIGPNGSGKSNLIDALLFVFGKRARKEGDEDEFVAVPGSGFSVARVAHANNRSEYLIDEVPTPFARISSLLKSKGIDLDNNRFLILQGEVELIAQMKPKGTNLSDVGLLEYLEELIGSDKYIEMIRNLSERLEAMTSEKESMQRRVRTVRQETEALAERKGDAENYLLQKAACIRLKIQKNSHSVFQFKKRESELKENLDNLQSQIEQAAPMSSDLRKEIDQYRAESRELEVKCHQMQRELELLGRQISEVECNDVRLQAEMKHAQTERDKIVSKAENLKEKMLTTENGARTAQSEIAKLQEQIATMNQDLQSQEARLDELRRQFAPELAALNNELTEARLSAAPYRQKLAQIEGTAKLKQAEHRVLTEKAQEPQKEAAKIQKKLELRQAQHAESIQEIQTEQQDFTQTKRALKEAEKQLKDASADVKALEDDLEGAEAALNEAKRDTTALLHQNEKLKVLIEAKASGSIPGIYGRLGDLGSIDARYDVAVSNCCAALEYVVVEAVEDAEAAGELLKQKRMSPMTFLILNKQAQLEQRMRAAFYCPDGATRLFDLIRVQDDRLKVAFYYGLRDMLVTDNLENATKIAFGDARRRYNIVTLKGEVLSDVGAMTGGGAPLKGKMRLGESAINPMLNHTEAAQMEEAASAELRRVQKELHAAKQKRDRVKQQCEHLEKDLEQQTTELRKKEVEAQSTQREIDAMQQALHEKQTQTQVSPDDAAKMRALEMEVSNLEKEWNDANGEASAQFQRVQEAEARIENVGNGAVKQLSDQIKNTKDKLTKSGAQIAQNQWTVENAPKKHHELEQNLAELVEKGQFLEQQIQSKQAQVQNVEHQFSQLTSKRDTLHESYTADMEIFKELRKKMEDKIAEVSAFHEQEEALKAQYENAKRSLNDEAQQMQESASEINRLTEQFIECLPDEEVPSFVEEELELLDVRLVEHQIQELTEALDQMQVNLTSVYQYRDKKKELEEKERRLATIVEDRNTIMQEYEDAKEKRLTDFLRGFNQIKGQLKRVYRSITNGGDADIELVDSFDPFSEGVEFSVRPPNKSWKRIANLSGGEKTLSSLSLIFALHYYRPTPVYVMDEIDAALDFRNVAITANYIASRTKNAQFIVISLRSQMFDKAANLVGVYKLQDCSHSVHVNPKNYLPPPDVNVHRASTSALQNPPRESNMTEEMELE